MKRLMLLFVLFFNLHYASAKTIDSTIIHAMEAAIENGTYPNIHSILISRAGGNYGYKAVGFIYKNGLSSNNL